MWPWLLHSIFRRPFYSSVELTDPEMLPSIPLGSVLTVAGGPHIASRLKRGDVVVHRFSLNGEKYFLVERLIGLPGEQVEIDKHGLVRINGHLLSEPYDTLSQGFPGVRQLAANEWYVIADNRQGRWGSSFWPPVLTQDILGVVVKVDGEPIIRPDYELRIAE